MVTWNEIRLIASRVLRWWWVLVLSVGIACGVAYQLSADEQRFYVAHATLTIGNTLESPVPDPNQLSVGSSLARYYGELARREPILRPIQEELKLPFTWQIISDRMLTTNVIANANLLEIYITDTNPDRAAAIAEAIGEKLIGFSPTAPDKIAAEQQAIQQQITASDAKINELQKKIADLKQQEDSATSASDLAEIKQKTTLLEESLAQEQTTYKGLLNYKSTSVINSLSFFEQAAPPKEPLPSQRKQIIGLAGAAGLMLGLAAMYVLEMIDPRIGGRRAASERLQIPDLGQIPVGPPLLIATDPFAQERLHATRDAQTNILLSVTDRQPRALMITSPNPSESRSSVSIDMADLFGRAGHRVLLVDADFTAALLTQMLHAAGGQQSWTVISGSDTSELWSHLRPTPIQNVALLPGPDRPGSPAILPSLRWRELVDHLSHAADVIIFDGPATLSGPDAALLAPHVDGVVLVMDPTTDNREDVEKSRQRLTRQHASRLLGTVTMTPSRQRGLRGRLRGLRAPAVPALPMPRAPETVEGFRTTESRTIVTPQVAEETLEEAEVIITPAPEPLIEVAVNQPGLVEKPPEETAPRRSRKASSSAAEPNAQPTPRKRRARKASAETTEAAD